MNVLDKNKEKIGEIGEGLVAKVLYGKISTDKYDMVKDIVVTVTGHKVEVKTQTRYWTKKAFTIDLSQSNQLIKCQNVDRLIFVEYGLSGHIRIWECLDRNYRVVEGGSRQMAAFDIGKMILINDLYLPDIASELCKLSGSGLKHLNDLNLYQ